MPRTLAERVTALEESLEALENEVRGGGSIPWRKSIAGRLYDVRQTLLAADKLAEATREVRRERARQWSRAEKVALFAFAGVTALASVLAAILPLVMS